MKSALLEYYRIKWLIWRGGLTCKGRRGEALRDWAGLRGGRKHGAPAGLPGLCLSVSVCLRLSPLLLPRGGSLTGLLTDSPGLALPPASAPGSFQTLPWMCPPLGGSHLKPPSCWLLPEQLTSGAWNSYTYVKKNTSTWKLDFYF